MDYKYIEQLLEQYWNGETTVEEEKILRSFFAQGKIPAGMSLYKTYFDYVHRTKETDVLGDDFDEKMLALIEDDTQAVKAVRINFTRRLRPLLKAVACICILITIGVIIKHSVQYNESTTGQKMATNKDSIDAGQPSVAENYINDTSTIIIK